MITIKKTKKGYFYVLPGSFHLSNVEILEAIKDGEVKFLNCDQRKEMMAMIGNKELNKDRFHRIEKSIKGDTALLNRIIRNGGLVSYAEKLERINK